MIEIDGRRIDYQDNGEGRPIVFVPGSFSAPSAWRGVQKKLPAGFRFVGTSLCGYGRTDETRNLKDLDMHHLVRVVEVVAQKLGEPIHLVGHSFGGTVALAAALAGSVEISSIGTLRIAILTALFEVSAAAAPVSTASFAWSDTRKSPSWVAPRAAMVGIDRLRTKDPRRRRKRTPPEPVGRSWSPGQALIELQILRKCPA